LASKKTYFLSDAHLGVDAFLSSKERELLLVEWLEQVKTDAGAIYFLGDIFDHWFEYKYVIPGGFNHLIGKLAELRRSNVPIYFFTGNHDMWMFGYFERELGIPVIRKPLFLELEGKQFYLGHGDGLPTGPRADRLLKAVFANRFLQWCFARLHPNFAIGLMRYFSRRSRIAHVIRDRDFNPEREYMIDFAEALTVQYPGLDYVVMGHRHLPIDLTLDNERTRYLNLGDWVTYFSYAVFDGRDVSIKFFKDEHTVYPMD
jgi:UDP-2,3-diacylglucosamine hydrolase